MTNYRSIFLEPDWVHVRYHGWQDSWPEPTVRILSKHHGPFQRHLVMSELADESRVLALLRQLRSRAGPMAEIILHDFACCSALESALPGIGFAPLPAAERLLNIATFVIDLRRSDEDLLARMSADCRRKIRKAQKEGSRFLVDDHPSGSTIAAFLVDFARIAAERSLQRPAADVVRRMFDDGRATLFTVEQGGDASHRLMTYRAGDKAIFLYGVGGAKSNSGAGNLLHWSAMRHLRQTGVNWYDFGGLASTSEADGIYRFKRGFGGELVDLGKEFGSRTFLAALVRRGAGMFRRLGDRDHP